MVKRLPFSWKVLHHNCNADKIEEYDVLKYREDFIKKLKKECGLNKEQFAEKLDREMMWQYWSRAEYELILERKDNQLYLKPWVGSRNPEEATIIATADNTLDWVAFSNWDKVNWWGDAAKIDIYDQLKFRWNDFVDFCWTYRHKYERVHREA